MLKRILISILFSFSLNAFTDAEEARIKQLENSFKNTPGFLSRTASSLISITVTGTVFFVGIKWLNDSFKKEDLKTKQDDMKMLDTQLQRMEKLKEERPTSRINAQPAKVTDKFSNIAGKIDKDVLEITDFIKEKNKYTAMGAKMPRGILLVGPPGTGKTSLARAIAGESDAYFIALSASEFIGIYAGEGPQRVRNLFAQARLEVASGKYKKAIIFIDELDAIGGARYKASDSASSEYRNILNELLNQMDGFVQDDSIFVLAATNREQDIDPALKRAGRFDRIVHISLPDVKSREAILSLYTRDIKHSKKINFVDLAYKTAGLSGADLKNLVNEAAIAAVRAQSNEAKQEHFESVLAKLVMAPAA